MNYETIRLEKGMYNHSGKNFSQVLESLDPSDGYRGTAFEGLDAFGRQLKRFGIKLRGADCSTVDKFFQSSESAVLFPEFVSRAVKAGIEQASVLPAITAVITEIDAPDYRPLSIPEDGMDYATEGGEIAASDIRLQAGVTPLVKFGRVLTASYESLRGQKLEPFAIALKNIGAQLAREHLKAAVDTILDGDGNSNGCVITSVSTLNYATLIDFWNTFSTYEMNTLLVSRDVAVALLKLPEFQHIGAGFDFQRTGKLVTPLGATLIPTGALEEGMVIGLDRNCALEMVTSPAVTVETDKLISRQLDRIAITSTAAFAKLCGGASKAICVNAD